MLKLQFLVVIVKFIRRFGVLRLQRNWVAEVSRGHGCAPSQLARTIIGMYVVLVTFFPNSTMHRYKFASVAESFLVIFFSPVSMFILSVLMTQSGRVERQTRRVPMSNKLIPQVECAS